jgi:hypothetical protein
MTRKDQMLEEFDGLAAAELDDITTLENGKPARVATIRPAVQLKPAVARAGFWDWLIGIGAVSLVILEERR